LLNPISKINSSNCFNLKLFFSRNPEKVKNARGVIDVSENKTAHTFGFCFLQQIFRTHHPELEAEIGVAVEIHDQLSHVAATDFFRLFIKFKQYFSWNSTPDLPNDELNLSGLYFSPLCALIESIL